MARGHASRRGTVENPAARRQRTSDAPDGGELTARQRARLRVSGTQACRVVPRMDELTVDGCDAQLDAPRVYPSSMSRGAMFCDESGSFGDGDRATKHDVIGGPVVPGLDADALRGRWERAFETLTELRGLPRPVHYAELSDEEKSLVVGQAAQCVREASGQWLIVTGSRGGADDVPFARYLRTLAQWAELAARLARASGATSIDAVLAQRTVPLSDEARYTADRAQTGILDDDSDKRRVLLRPVAREAVTRVLTLDRLEEESASRTRAHAGLHLADVVCGAVRTAFYDGVGVPALWPAHLVDALLVIDHRDVRALCELDELSREDDLDLVRLAERCARLDARAAGERGHAALTARGAARLARAFFAHAVARWEQRDDRALAGLVARLAGAVHGRLEEKSGQYEGAWRALELAWAGDGALARRARALAIDAERRAALDRMTIECANHRGDVAAAELAWERFRAGVAGLRSLAVLAESLRAHNVWHGALQNRLPAPADEIEVLRARLAADGDALERRATSAGELADVVPDVRADDGQDRDVPASDDELRLWSALGEARGRCIPDREVGRCFGTVARTWAFLGDHERAVRAALQARRRFGDDAFDLRFNAIVLLTILCDEARVAGAERARSTAIAALLDQVCGARFDRPREVVTRLDAAPGERFALDRLLRALLWARSAVRAPLARAWREHLAEGRDSVLFKALALRHRTHPSELLARHAAELSEGAARAAWLALSLELTDAAPEGSTLRRFSAFTRGLQGGAPVAEAVAGSELAPTFEYR